MSKSFLRWCGSKRKLLPKILPFFPGRFDNYVEPFLGGGSVFFALAAEKPRRFGNAWLFDVNADLINAFRWVRDDVRNVNICLQHMPANEFEEYRDRYNKTPPSRRNDVSHAARFIYLNRCGFNGVYRVNSNGEYNVPFGRRSDGSMPVVIDDEYEKTLRECSRMLQGVRLMAGHFEQAIELVYGIDAFAYADPPYLKLEAGSFDTYTKGGFAVSEHEFLCRRLRETMAKFVMSSSDTPEGRRIFAENGFTMHPIVAPRSSHGQLLANAFAKELVVTP